MTTELFRRFEPEYEKSNYNARDAVAFALASLLAYRDKGEVESQIRLWGFSEVRPFEFRRGRDVDTQGYIAANGDRVLVAFRGTESFPDWLTNLQAVKDPGPWGKVHEGFQDSFLVSALVIGKMIGEMRGNREIWITGHSLGGALAVLLAATLAENSIDVTGLYTFAAPRVGDRAFARELKRSLKGKAHWRVVNEGDLVPHLPSELRFSHSGDRRLLVDGKISGDVRKWNSFKQTTWGWIGRVGRLASLKLKAPHSLQHEDGYLPKLIALAQAPDRSSEGGT